jgi:hypothetical protein
MDSKYLKQVMDSKYLKSFSLMMCNVSPGCVAEYVYGRHHEESYLTSKTLCIATDPLRWVTTLDSVSLGRLCKMVADYDSLYFAEEDYVIQD